MHRDNAPTGVRWLIWRALPNVKMPSPSGYAEKKNGDHGVEALMRLYASPLPSARSGPLYNAVSYPTKISPEAIAVFIATHTKPGDLILDVFAGSGTTGLAAMLCDKPTAEMRRIAKELGVSPLWGPRRALLYELGVLGALISRTMCTPPDPEEFRAAAERLIEAAAERIGSLYEVQDPRGRPGTLRHAIWSDVLVCPHCKAETLYADAIVKRNPIRFSEKVVCRSCRRATPARDMPRSVEQVFDALLRKHVTTKKRRLWMVYGQTGTLKWKRRATASDARALREVDKLGVPSAVPVTPIAWGDLKRNGYHTGITHIHHFYTRRNLIVMGELWKTIDQFAHHIQDALRTLVLSYNATHSTLMTRVVAKQGQRELILTGAQSGVLYVSGMPVEKNILAGLRRKARVLAEAFTAVHGSKSTVSVENRSSTKLSVKDDSVDYVFTDPPFGDYIPYAELNQLNEAWLRQMTPRSEEIIVSRAQNKDEAKYGELMGCVFSELNRVLKPRASATIVFHSAKAAVWRALAEAFARSGFRVDAYSVLDKVQPSFKQVVSDVFVKGDPLLLLRKAAAPTAAADATSSGIANRILNANRPANDNQNGERVQRMYARYVSECLEAGVPISMNAGSFFGKARLQGR